MTRFTRWIALALACSLVGTGCFGSFKLTNKVYDFNKGVGGKLLQTVVFWAFAILPVYGLAVFVDAWIFNLIEFWSGGDPLAKGEQPADVDVAAISPDVLRLRRVVEGKVVDEIQLVRIGDRAGEVRRADGTVVSSVEALTDGSIAVTANGSVKLYPASDVVSLAQAYRDGTFMARLAELRSDAMIASR